MRRLSLLLCALALVLPAAITPVHANGVANVPPNAVGYSSGNISVLENNGSLSQVYQTTWTGGPNWSAWASYGLQTPPFNINGNMVQIDAPGTQDWTILNDGKLYCVASRGTWAAQSTAIFDGIDKDATPAIFKRSDGSLRLYGNLLLHDIYTNTMTNTSACGGSFGTWTTTGGGSYYSPGAAGSTDTDTLLTVTGKDGITAAQGCGITPWTSQSCGYLWWKYGATWHGPITNIGASSAMSVVTSGVGLFDLFFRGWDGAMYTSSDGATATGLGGTFDGGPGCIEPTSSRIDCFAVGGGVVWHAARVNGTWTVFSSGTGHDLWQSLGTA